MRSAQPETEQTATNWTQAVTLDVHGAKAFPATVKNLGTHKRHSLPVYNESYDGSTSLVKKKKQKNPRETIIPKPPPSFVKYVKY